MSSNGQFLPLLTDPVLDVGLTAGTYYLAVSSSGNMPDLNANPPGANDIFTPNVTESGANGSSTGPYVLNVLVQPAAPAPHVVAASIRAGATLTTAPTRFTVTFDSAVNLTALANQADSGSVTTEPTISSVFILEPNGQQVFPGLLSYDAATHQATFLMLDRLPNGVNQLHLSGPDGLPGLGGNPLVGNDPSGDYVVSFTVADPLAPADPLNRTQAPLNEATGTGQDLGVLFPAEVQNGVTVAGTLAASASSDSYTMQLLEPQEYQFSLDGPPSVPGGPLTPLSADLQIAITDATGAAVVPLPNGNAGTLLVNLAPGFYTIQISRPAGDAASSVPYVMLVTMLYTHDNPPPLSVGSTPFLQIRAISDPSAPVSPSSPVVSVPSSTNPFGGNALAALTSSTDLAGGITNTTTGSALASAAPLQVQGLGNAPVALASNVPIADVTLVSFAATASSNPTNQVSTGDATALMDFLAAFWNDWRTDEWLPRSAAPATSLQPNPQPGLERTDVSRQQSRPSDMNAGPEVAPRRLTEAASAVFLAAEETTTPTPGQNAIHTGANQTARGPLTLLGAIFSVALAGLFVLARTRLAPERRDQRRDTMLDQTVDFSN